eukprot:366128-Chlamydomonas_euryale.AAC.10
MRAEAHLHLHTAASLTRRRPPVLRAACHLPPGSEGFPRSATPARGAASPACLPPRVRRLPSPHPPRFWPTPATKAETQPSNERNKPACDIGPVSVRRALPGSDQRMDGTAIWAMYTERRSACLLNTLIAPTREASWRHLQCTLWCCLSARQVPPEGTQAGWPSRSRWRARVHAAAAAVCACMPCSAACPFALTRMNPNIEAWLLDGAMRRAGTPSLPAVMEGSRVDGRLYLEHVAGATGRWKRAGRLVSRGRGLCWRGPTSKPPRTHTRHAGSLLSFTPAGRQSGV